MTAGARLNTEAARHGTAVTTGAASGGQPIPHDSVSHDQREAFWRALWDASDLVLELPHDHQPLGTGTAARQAVNGEAARPAIARVTLPLPAAVDGLAMRGAACRFEVLLAAFRVLLWRHTGQARLPVLARCDCGDRAEILLCANPLERGQTFADVVNAESHACAAARAHGGVPRVPGGATPECQVTFSCSPNLNAAAVDAAAAGAPTAAGAPVASPDLGLTILNGPGGMSAAWDFNSAVFREDTVSRVAERYPVLLAAALARPETPIGDLPVLSETDAEQLRTAGLTRSVGELDARTLVDLVGEWVTRTPGAVATRQGPQARSYADVAQLSDQVAACLGELGLAPETRVGLALRRSADVPGVILGVMRAGLAVVPLDPSSPTARNTAILDDASAPVVIQDHSEPSLIPGPWQVLSIEDMRQRGGVAPAETSVPAAAHPRPDGLAYVLYTSGSTGTPKGVAVNHHSLANTLRATRSLLAYPPGARWIAVSRLAFDISLFELFTPLVSGGEVVITTEDQSRNGQALRELLERSAADFMQATPAIWQMLLDSGWQGDPRLVTLTGGDVMSPALAQRLIDRSKTFWHTYGPTEATLYCVSTPLESALDYSALPLGDPIANMRVRVLDDELRPVPPGVTGELCLSGVGLARGYLNRPELTAERFVSDSPVRERLYRTGDLALIRPDGRLELRGRSDGQVKIRGYRIEVGEIESVLARHPAVAAAAVVRAGSLAENHHLVAYLQLASADGPASDGTASDGPASEGTASDGTASDGPASEGTASDGDGEPVIADVAAHAARHLPAYMLPASYQVLRRLPVTPNGKLDRAALASAETRRPDGAEFVPRMEEEAAVAEVWRELLEIDHVSSTDDFFEIGGNSLLAVRAVKKLGERFAVELSTWMVFDAPTIPELADLVHNARSACEEKP